MTQKVCFYGTLRNGGWAEKNAKKMTQRFLGDDTIVGFKLVSRPDRRTTIGCPVIIYTGNFDDRVEVSVHECSKEQLQIIDEYEGTNITSWHYWPGTVMTRFGPCRAYVGKIMQENDTLVPHGDWIRFANEQEAAGKKPMIY